jgi:hypothetical protein
MMDDTLTPAELAVLKAALLAPRVKRPERPELEVGDQVVVYGSTRSSAREITRIGPKWITVGEGRAALRFSRATWRGDYGYGTGSSIRTLEQDTYDRRIEAARKRLSGAGITINYQRDVPDGRVLAIAALLDLLDETEV